MDDIYAETINSFAYDLNNLWKDKNKFKAQPLKHNGPVKNKEDDNCSLKRFLLSVNNTHVDTLKPKSSTDILTNIDRLAKSASIWTRPELSRVETDSILLKFEKGIFIVRLTLNKRTMILSYRAEDKVQHVMIKVDLKNGFFMDGSSNIFRNVNMMISHYMSHSIQTPDILLRLPRALREATCVKHFKFFENLKLDFWKTPLTNKSISEIWPNDVAESRKSEYRYGYNCPLNNCGKFISIQEFFGITEYHDNSADVKCKMASKISQDEKYDKYNDMYSLTKRYMCAICIDKFVDCSLECGHVFCMSCGKQYDKCPICRRESKIKMKLFLN